MSTDRPITADLLGEVHGDGQEDAIIWLTVGLTARDDGPVHGASREKVVGRVLNATGAGLPPLMRARRDGVASALCDVARGVAGGSLARFLAKEDLAGQPHPTAWPSEVINPAGRSSEQVTEALAAAAERLLAPEGQRIESPLIEVRLIGSVLPSQERWGHAASEEPDSFTGDFATREEAIDDGASTYEADFYLVRGTAPRAADLVDSCIADDIFERMTDHVAGNFGFEQGEAFASAEPTAEAKAELVALVKAWANRHVPIGFWNGKGKVERIENGGPMTKAEGMTREQAVAVARDLIDGDGITARYVQALEVLIAHATAPAPLAIRQDIDALEREAGAHRFAIAAAVGKTEVRYADGIKRALDVLRPHLQRIGAPLPTPEQIAATWDQASIDWYTSDERRHLSDADRQEAKDRFQGRAVLALFGPAAATSADSAMAEAERPPSRIYAAGPEANTSPLLAACSAAGMTEHRTIEEMAREAERLRADMQTMLANTALPMRVVGPSAADFARDLQSALAEADEALRLAIDVAKGSQKPRFITAREAVVRLRNVLAAGAVFAMRTAAQTRTAEEERRDVLTEILRGIESADRMGSSAQTALCALHTLIDGGHHVGAAGRSS